MCNVILLVNDQGWEMSCCGPCPRPSSPTAARGLAWQSPVCFPPLPASTSCLQEGPALLSLFVMVFQGGRPFLASGHGRLLPAHSSIMSSSQLAPLSFYSCCPGICQDTQYCAAASGLLRPEVRRRVCPIYHFLCLNISWSSPKTLIYTVALFLHSLIASPASSTFMRLYSY